MVGIFVTSWLSKVRNRTEEAMVIFSAHCPISVANLPKRCNPIEIVVLVMLKQCSTQKTAYLYQQLTADQGTKLTSAFLLLFRHG
jgi:hypothetical protein